MENQLLAIHGVPRSGTTWLGQIVNSHPEVVYKYQPLFSYELKGFLSNDASREQIDEFFRLLANTNSPFLDQEAGIEKGIIPRFQKGAPRLIAYKEVRYHHILENMLHQHDGVKAIGIVRNPLAVIHSWLKSPREFRRDLGWDEETEWRFAQSKNQYRPEEFFGYEKWKEVAQLFEQLATDFPDRFRVVMYADLLHNTEQITRGLFEFLALDWSPQTSSFLHQSTMEHQPDTYSVYKSKAYDNDWKRGLSPTISEAIQVDIEGSLLEKYLAM